ncbi:MAG: phage tail family protein [Firmicutes bacterium]|nr:phage tail family protein [Bacillota bacterium]
MRTGFTYKGIHSSAYGITVKTQDRPIIPAAKTKTYSALYMDGTYDFSEANPYERRFYEERVFTEVLQITAENLSELQKSIGKIAVWLLGGGDLIFDDTPNVRWTARCDGSISFAPERRGKSAVVTVQFKVSAFAYSRISTLDGALIGDPLPLESNIPLDMPSFYTHTFAAAPGVTSNDVTITVPNFGDRPFRPVITITAADEDLVVPDMYFSTGGSSVVFDCGSRELSVKARDSSGAHPSIAVDFDLQKVTVDGGEGTVMDISGEFFEMSGENPCLTVTARIVNNTEDDIDCTVTVDFTPQAVWDLDFDSVEWED